MNWAIKIITDLCARKFYGKITISLVAGKIVLICKEETLKPDNQNNAPNFLIKGKKLLDRREEIGEEAHEKELASGGF